MDYPGYSGDAVIYLSLFLRWRVETPPEKAWMGFSQIKKLPPGSSPFDFPSEISIAYFISPQLMYVL